MGSSKQTRRNIDFKPERDIWKFQALLFPYFVSLSNLINLSQELFSVYKMGIMKFSRQDFVMILYTHIHTQHILTDT